MDEGGEGPLPQLVLQNGQSIRFCIAGMDDDRKLHFARHADMHSEQVLLHLAIRMVVIIVKTGLANGDHTGVFGRIAQDFC